MDFGFFCWCQLGSIFVPKVDENLIMKASWAVLGASWSVLGSSGSVMEASWSVLGAFWSVLERLERVFKRLGRVLTEIMLPWRPVRRSAGPPGTYNYQDTEDLHRKTTYRKTTYRETTYRVSVESECRE